MDFYLKQIAPGAPIFEIYYDKSEIGLMTIFPGEGPMATVKFQVTGQKRTVAHTNAAQCFFEAQEAFCDLIEEYLSAQEFS